MTTAPNGAAKEKRRYRKVYDKPARHRFPLRDVATTI